MNDKIFFDTNLWVYLFSEEDGKGRIVSNMIKDNFKNIHISSQVLGELFNVLTKKKITDLEKAQKIVTRISDDFSALSIDKEIVKKAIELKLRYGYSYWDSLVIASALDLKCGVLFTEDLQHGQIINEELKIINPYAKPT